MSKLNFLGAFQLSFEAEEIRFDNNRIPALLAYLVLHRGQPILRRHLAFIFWPDSSERQALTNLRNLLFKLGREWPQVRRYLHIERQQLTWRDATGVEADLVRFEEAVGRVESVKTDREVSSPTDGVGVEAALVDAIGCYGGELLPGHYDDWLLLARERLHDAYCRLLAQLTELLQERRRYDEALVYAEKLIHADPLQEQGYCFLMQVYAAQGNRALALRTYHACATLLERELDAQPSSQTQALYSRLLELDQSSVEQSAPLSQISPLVGRGQEWQSALSTWQEAKQGQTRLLLLAGEAGIGKTRLAEELADKLRHLGHTVAVSRAYAAEGAFAYAPVAAWLRSPALRQAIRGLDAIWQVELSRLLPEIQIEHPKLPTPGPLREGWQRQRFFESIVHLIHALPKPVLLHVDDLQWCDQETLTLLHYLLRAVQDNQLLIVGTVRSEEVDEDHPLARLLRVLRQDDIVLEIELGPLSAAETATLAEQIYGGELPPHVQAQLYRESEGHPLFLMEMVRMRSASLRKGVAGAEDLSEGQFWPAVTAPKIQAVIGARLAQLSPPARQLANLAAVVGRQFEFDILHAAGELDDAALVQALDELWRRRIVRSQGDYSYDFSHDQIRDVAYAEMSPVRRRQYHGLVAAALRTVRGESLDSVSGELAYHYEASGDVVQAVIFYMQAGEVALASYAGDRGLHYFAKSSALVQTPTDAARALFGMGRAHFALDQLDVAIDYFAQALAQCDETHALRPRILFALGDAHIAQFAAEAAEPYVVQALSAAEAVEDHETLCQALSLMGQIQSHRGQLDSEHALIRRALATAREAGNDWREARTLADLGFLQAQCGDFAGAAMSARAALELLDATGDLAGQAFAWNILGRAEGGRGHYRAAFEAFDRSEELADTINLHSIAAQIPNMRGWLYQQLGDFERSYALNQQGLALALARQKDTAEISARLNLCMDEIYLGRAADAWESLVEIEARLADNDFGFHGWRWRLRLLYAQGVARLRLGDSIGTGSNLSALADAGMALARQTKAVKYVALNHELAGMAHLTGGAYEPAVTHLEQAMALADQIAYQPLRREARVRLADLFARQGERARAMELADEAQDIAESVAAHIHEETLRRAFLARSAACAIEIEAQATPGASYSFEGAANR